MPIGIHCKI